MKKEKKFFGIVILCFLMVGAIVGDVMYACPCVPAPTKPTPTEPNYGKFQIEGKLSDEHPAYIYRLGLLYAGDKVKVVIKGGLVKGDVLVTLKKGELTVEEAGFWRPHWRGNIQQSEYVFEVPANGIYSLIIERGGMALSPVSYMGDVELLPLQRKSDEVI